MPGANAATKQPVDLDEVRRRILTLCTDQGVSLREASIKLGKNPAYLQQYIHRGTPASLPERTRKELAGTLGIQETLLAPPEMRRDMAAIRQLEAGIGARGARLPIAGYARGGIDVLTFNENQPSAFVDRPPELDGVDEAFAIEVSGDSHAPRCKSGEVVVVNPRVSPSRHADVVVRMADGSAIVAEYLGRSGPVITVHKTSNGDQELVAEDVIGIYPITHIMIRPNRYSVQ